MITTEVGFAIELVEVTKRYGPVTALSAIDLDIVAGEFLVLLGPSGCGKSTILKVVAGLEDATDGEVYINGKLANFVRPKDRDVAMVFQNYALYPHMTVARNIGFPLKMRGVPKSQLAERVIETARLLELEDQLEKYPGQLSGGQRQRVALGRAIIREPVAFLMDEPLSNLDALLRVQMRSELLTIHRRVGRTTVYVTHDQVEAMTMADRIVVLREGAVQQVGSSDDVYLRPANTFVATFVGSPQMNLYQGVVHRHDGTSRLDAGTLAIEFAPDIPAGDSLMATVGIRPEHVVVDAIDAPGSVAGVVHLLERVGAEDFVTVTIADGLKCTVRTAARMGIEEGDRIAVRFPLTDLHVFDADGTRIGPSRA